MVKTKREYILVTFIISLISFVIAIVSVATNSWINSDGIFYQTKQKSGIANYGLFNGEWNVDINGTKFEHKISLRCVVSENICGWSYEETNQKQLEEIKEIYEHCDNNDGPKCDLQFINAGLWICTLLFLFISLFSTLCAMLLSILNYYTNPTRDFLSIQGIFIWNCISSIGYLFSLIMWGAEFGSVIINNIAISDTLKGQFSSDGLASLGFSYWILLMPMFLHVGNIGVLYYRKYQIDKEPTMPKLDVDPSKDGVSFMY